MRYPKVGGKIRIGGPALPGSLKSWTGKILTVTIVIGNRIYTDERCPMEYWLDNEYTIHYDKPAIETKKVII